MTILLLLQIEIGVTQEAGEFWPKRVLITNNNGIDNVKIMQLARAFAKVVEAYVVSSFEDRSKTTHFTSIVSKGSIAA
jgi:hypothetical protein